MSSKPAWDPSEEVSDPDRPATASGHTVRSSPCVLLSVLGRTIDEPVLTPSQFGNHLCQDFWPLGAKLKSALKTK